MPLLIKPKEVKVVSQDGEVHMTISLELTINLNTDGLRINATAVDETVDEKPVGKKEDTAWAIPDFGVSPKLNFGKKE